MSDDDFYPVPSVSILPCPLCGEKITQQVEHVGKLIICPHCDRQVRLRYRKRTNKTQHEYDIGGEG